MPDTGQAAGQQCEIALRLSQNGGPLSYANKAAFESAGWLLNYRAAQTDQTPEYTLVPHTDASLAAIGWHLVALRLVNGQGPLIVDLPQAGSGWKCFPPLYHVAAESTDLDQNYSAIQQSVGVATALSQTVSIDAEVTEGDGLQKQFTALETALTLWGFTNANLADGTLVLTGSVRAIDNRVGEPNAYIGVSVVMNDPGENPILAYGWATFPTGLAFPAVDPTNDADVAPVAYALDVAFTGAIEHEITGGSQGSKTFTVAGDLRSWYNRGSTVTITGSTGNDGSYTVVSSTYNGTSTTVTVSETVPHATIDGDFTHTIKQTLGAGTLTVKRQEDRQ